ncbi:MAG: hypothetical protein V9E83_05260 [Baekduia sp.]
MRGACIDIGSNTTRLLVADVHDGEIEPVSSERVFLPLTGIESGGELAHRRLGTLLEVVARLAAKARAHGVAEQALIAIATQALRSLPEPESATVVAGLEAAAGTAVELLSPEREAELAFAGSTIGLDARTGPFGVIDIGGGSTELICGDRAGALHWWCSVPVGSRVLTEAHLPSDPPTTHELAAATAAAELALGGRRPPLDPRRVLTVGGGTQSLARLLGDRPADPRSLTDALQTLTAAPAIEVAAAHGLDEQRTRLLPAALVLLRAATSALGQPALPGGGGVREGALYEAAGRP